MKKVTVVVSAKDDLAIAAAFAVPETPRRPIHFLVLKEGAELPPDAMVMFTHEGKWDFRGTHLRAPLDSVELKIPSWAQGAKGYIAIRPENFDSSSGTLRHALGCAAHKMWRLASHRAKRT